MRLINADKLTKTILHAYSVERPDTQYKMDNFVTKEIPAIINHFSIKLQNDNRIKDIKYISLGYLKELRDEIIKKTGDQAYLDFDDRTYSIVLYNFDGINMFLSILERRLQKVECDNENNSDGR